MKTETREKIVAAYQDISFEKIHLMEDVSPACVVFFLRHEKMGAQIAVPMTGVQAICLVFALLEVFAESQGALDPYLKAAWDEIARMELKKG